MNKYLYILIILYNLNLILNVFVEITVKNITLFNYKNSVKYNNSNFFFDNILYYNYYLKNNYSKILLVNTK